ncbi:MAG: roadblock/LC7 domain-containing protein [Promethearchaeota archaeon]
MIIDDSGRLDEVLHEILYSMPEIMHIIIIDRDGILVTSLSRAEENLDEIGEVSVFSGAMFESAVAQGACMDIGSVEFQLTEYSDGFLFGISVGQGLLTLMSRKSVPIGNVFQVLKQYRDEICSLLSNYEITDVPLTDEIKSLFQSQNFEGI